LKVFNACNFLFFGKIQNTYIGALIKIKGGRQRPGVLFSRIIESSDGKNVGAL